MTRPAYIDAESLRRNGFARLTERAAPTWLTLALAHGDLTVRHAVTRWSASAGDVAGHALRLAVDAQTLARLDHNPMAEELLIAALSGAAAGCAGESITHVALAWDGTVQTEAQGYRSAPDTRVKAPLRDAVEAWQRARGEAVTAAHEITHEGDTVFVRGEALDATARGALEHAVRALSGARVVRWR
ncbi:MAG: hypothetical protein U0325_04105 [Polyangiales bacterium]